VKLALRFPSPTFVASLLLDTINDPVELVISPLFSHTAPASSVILAGILTVALLAPRPQPIFTAGFFPKLTFVFELFAFAASLHFGYLPQFLKVFEIIA